jgi:hypothetical protein
VIASPSQRAFPWTGVTRPPLEGRSCTTFRRGDPFDSGTRSVGFPQAAGLSPSSAGLAQSVMVDMVDMVDLLGGVRKLEGAFSEAC